jgi:hypothetical protein
MDDGSVEWMRAKIQAQLKKLAETGRRLAEQIARAKERQRRSREARGETTRNGDGSGPA